MILNWPKKEKGVGRIYQNKINSLTERADCQWESVVFV